MRNLVKIIDVDIDIPKYGMETLALGPKNPILETFNSKPILAEVDSLLEFCESRIEEAEVKNNIECATAAYNKKAKLGSIDRNVEMTRKFLKHNDLLAVPIDKSNGFAVMKKASYQSKILTILNGQQFEKSKAG